MMIERVKFFLWWCAGADLDALKASPTDHARYTALGMMMLVVPCIATVSFSFFVTQTFDLSTVPAFLLGTGWGAIVFVLDRLILTFHRKGQFEFARAVPRFILALSLAFMIGEPLLVRLFHSEIDLQLRREAQTVGSNARTIADARVAPERVALLNANAEMQGRLDQLKTIRDDKENAVIGEIEGVVGSKIQGDGPAAGRKKEAFSDARAAYENARTELEPQISRNKQRLEVLRTQVDNEVTELEQSHKAAGSGMMTRHQALFAIMRREPGAALTYLPLFLILALLEIAPLVSKLTFPTSEYDVRLAMLQKNAIAKTRRVAASERESHKAFMHVQNKLRRRIAKMATDVTVPAASDLEVQIGDLLRTTILEGFRSEILLPSSNSHRNLGPELAIEVMDHPELRVRLQMPDEGRNTITLSDLESDVRCISQEIVDDDLPSVSLLKATSSSGREVHADLPLLLQLEKDQALCLTFASDSPNSELHLV